MTIGRIGSVRNLNSISFPDAGVRRAAARTAPCPPATAAASTRRISANRRVSRRELAGRRAGVGYSAVVIGTTSAQGPPAEPSRRRSLRRNRPRSSLPRPPYGRRRPARQPLARRAGARRAGSPSAMSGAYVGVPCWSATTRSVSREAARREHGLQEIGAVGGIDPGRPQDHVPGVGRQRPRSSRQASRRRRRPSVRSDRSRRKGTSLSPEKT